MAANPKQLRIVDARPEGRSTRILEIECIEGGAFETVGGKYVIVHTGVVLSGAGGDKAVKRAYSLMPVAARPGRAELAVKRLEGPGSSALHDAPIGATFGFSGPWGKLVPEDGLGERTLLVATDTGITSAIGIVEQHASSPGPRPLEVLWLTAPGEDFLDVQRVRARLEDVGVHLVSAEIGAIDSASRAGDAWHFIDARARGLRATHVVATGDGAIVHPLRQTLPARVPSVRDVRIECFFKNPEKKSA
jgi:ferredoxin-NADP reductase